MTDPKEPEPIIIVTATTTQGFPINVTSYPSTTASGLISGSTLQPITKDNLEEKVAAMTAYIDSLKNIYQNEEREITRVTEKETIDRGWLSHMSFSAKFNFDDCSLEVKIEGVPRKEIKTKETEIETIKRKNR
jgi:hypothetical protein